jgi:hypothetical protein
MSKKDIFGSARHFFLQKPELIDQTEEVITNILVNDVMLEVAEQTLIDFSERPLELLPFWQNYPPEQRGRQPKGTSIPWLELGEKTISSNFIKQLGNVFPQIQFPGLPTGGDIRFWVNDVFVHLDIKLTGPNDNPDEVVVPPNQVSGDGYKWDRLGVLNNSHPIIYLTGSTTKGKVNYYFQPKLPPIYVIDKKPLLCLTLFLEAVYDVKSLGDHPLKYFEISCVPNGLNMFLGPKYANTKGLLIAGKDDNTKDEDTKRIRVRLDPLTKIQPWRSIKIIKNYGEWQAIPRNSV